MNKNQKLGKSGEDCAIEFLLQNGYRILGRNFRCKYGEIDVIVIKDAVEDENVGRKDVENDADLKELQELEKLEKADSKNQNNDI